MKTETDFSIINIILGTYFMMYMFFWLLKSLYIMFNYLAWFNSFMFIFILFNLLRIADKEIQICYKVI